MNTLRFFFNPASIAVVGASADKSKAGHQILSNTQRLGFRGRVYPVNPKESRILGLKCYRSLADVPGEVELMVVVVPAEGVPAVFEQARDRGDVKAAVIVAAGFSETGDPERARLEHRVLEIARQAGIRVLGPNCVGVMNVSARLDTTLEPNVNLVPGGVSVLSQSGSVGATILLFAGDQPAPLGFSKWAHVGNMIDVDLLELLQYYREDADTKTIVVYMEGIDNARRFVELAGEVAREKPVIVLKVGRTSMGSAATISHTGALAGVDAVYEGAFAQWGIVRVDNVRELLDTAKALSMQPIPRGDRICVLTEAGGPGVIATDELVTAGYGHLASLSGDTVESLRRILPPMALINRPAGYVDMTAAAMEHHHAEALDVVLADPGVDGVLLLSVPPNFLDPAELGRQVAQVAARHRKPVLTCLLAGDWVGRARQYMEEAGFPTFDMPNEAARALSNMIKRRKLAESVERAESKQLTAEVRASSLLSGVAAPELDVSNLLSRARQGGGPTEVTARQVLDRWGVDTGRYALVASEEEAFVAADQLGYPVVLKVVSPHVVHKSDVGGVKLGLHSPAALAEGLAEMRRRIATEVPQARLDGFLLAPQARPGSEVIIGGLRDRQMGPVVMFGLGGVLVEVYRDVVFRTAPVNREVARRMIESVRGYPLLCGYRGSAEVDLEAIADVIIKLSRIISTQRDVVELELNPVRAYPDGLSILDARVVVA